MKLKFAGIAVLSLLATQPALAEHAGVEHPAEQVQGKPIANPPMKVGLPPGVQYSDRKVHAGGKHPAEAVQGEPIDNPAPRTGLPPGVQPSQRKVHAGREHPAVAAKEVAQPSPTEAQLPLPVGVKP